MSVASVMGRPQSFPRAKVLPSLSEHAVVYARALLSAALTVALVTYGWWRLMLALFT